MIHFAWPFVFLLLPLPWIIFRWFPRVRVQDTLALKIPFFNQIVDLTKHKNSLEQKRKWKQCITYSIWFLLVLAAARPEWLGKNVSMPRIGRNIMMAIDISGSMQIPDMALQGKTVDRLSVVKQVAGSFIEKRKGDRIGLIVFGSKAYLQTPLTFDHTTLQAMLNDATIGLAGRKTAVGDAIGLAIKKLKETSSGQRVLILLTDGASNAGTVLPLDAAHLAAKNNLRIYTIGIGSDTLPIADFFGQQLVAMTSDLDEETLEIIAKTTQGLFFRARDTQSLMRVYEAIDRLEPHAVDKAIFRHATPLYPWPLGIALILSLFLVWQWIMPRIQQGERYSV